MVGGLQRAECDFDNSAGVVAVAVGVQVPLRHRGIGVDDAGLDQAIPDAFEKIVAIAALALGHVNRDCQAIPDTLAIALAGRRKGFSAREYAHGRLVRQRFVSEHHRPPALPFDDDDGRLLVMVHARRREGDLEADHSRLSGLGSCNAMNLVNSSGAPCASRLSILSAISESICF
jgi:hypothetical protein